ncbi:DENN domain-containing protein 1B isoform X2 [Carcharodon carcharias]|uniref:DENN domain-containing protein 1B isoform X2 n=1 Tax=Carcharodon carcharias TaxID=13397 RepID=UPI001B7DAE5A|nr:DENN domain-containing protein 1B isoform X2 [Carcharodon carcharias]
MDCRLKESPERTFDLVFKVTCPASENEDPVVVWKFPKDFRDQEVLQTVPKFCFPFDVERVSQSQVGQHFTFVLTDIESKQRFGFCRLTSGCKVCVCILSYLPWFEVYYKLLNTLADLLVKEQENDLNDVLETLYKHDVPVPNTPVNLSLHSYFITPDTSGLPTIPESRNMTEYFVAVDVNNMLQLYASMLHERRIIITSSKLSTLTACVHASAAVLYPMYWQHIYIPVLPPHLLDYCCAPMPYLVGVHLSLMEKVKNKALDDVIILNVDTNTLETPFDDLHNLPSEVVASLKYKLKKQSTATGDGVARAFLKAQAALFGSYRDALRYKPGEPITFCEESYVAHRSSTIKHFLQNAVQLQLFKQFIDGRLEKLNAGKGFSDVFEDEITAGGYSGGNSKSYQQWMHTVKKGGALINTVMTKANPAMKTAYKYAKNQAKMGIKEVRSMLKQKETNEDDELHHSESLSPNLQRRSNSDLLQNRLPATKRKRIRPQRSSHAGIVSPLDADEADRASKLSSEDSGEVCAYIDDSDDSEQIELESESPGQMDLLGEILDTLSTHSSDQGKLCGAKSLDFFKSMDDISYKAVHKSNTPSEGNLAEFDEGYGDHLSWHLGQDDTVVHRRPLPPSPRKSFCYLTECPATFETPSCDNSSVFVDKLTTFPQLNSDSSFKTSVATIASNQESNQEKKISAKLKEPKRTLTSEDSTYEEQSQNTAKYPSALIPWEKEDVETELIKPTSEIDLLKEIDCLCSRFETNRIVSSIDASTTNT